MTKYLLNVLRYYLYEGVYTSIKFLKDVARGVVCMRLSQPCLVHSLESKIDLKSDLKIVSVVLFFGKLLHLGRTLSSRSKPNLNIMINLFMD